MKNHLFEDKKGVIHIAEIATMGRDTNWAFTKCGKDVPENSSFRSYEKANCINCIIPLTPIATETK